jgi:hypothetical protein
LAFAAQGGIPSRAASVAASEVPPPGRSPTSGIQTVNDRENAVAGRLKAQDAASAVARPEGALAGERFVIGQARPEHDPRSV